MGYLHFPLSLFWSNERSPHLSVKTEIAVSIVWNLDCVNRKETNLQNTRPVAKA
jgi:hypothetical protein